MRAELEGLIEQWINEYRLSGRWNKHSSLTVYYWGRYFARYFKRHYKITAVGKIKSGHLSRYYKDRLGCLSVRTQLSEYQYLSSFLNWCIDRGLLLYAPLIPWPIPARARNSFRCLSMAKIRLILDAIETTNPEGIQDRAIVEMFYATAIRRCELTALNLSDVDVAQGQVWIHHGKGDTGRIVPITHSSLGWIRRYLKQGRSALVKNFDCSSFFLGISGRRLGKNHIAKLMKQLREDTDITPLSAHVLRHSCASHLMHAGVALAYIKLLLGHKGLRSTQIYLDMYSLEELRELYDQAHPRDKWEIPVK